MSTSPTVPSLSSTYQGNLSNLILCPYTYVATRMRQDSAYYSNYPDNSQRATIPRVCRLRTNDNTFAIYALVDPITEHMIASDVCVNMLVEQLSEISFDDNSYGKKINDSMKNIFYETENRLLQMTFDRAEKMTSSLANSGAAEKVLASLDEAQSGAFLFVVMVTQSYVYVSYVGQ